MILRWREQTKPKYTGSGLFDSVNSSKLDTDMHNLKVSFKINGLPQLICPWSPNPKSDAEEILESYHWTLMGLEPSAPQVSDENKNSTYVVNKTALRKEHWLFWLVQWIAFRE
jgi:hypothetical protein